MKKCNQCDQLLDEAKFHKKGEGFRSICKYCYSDSQKLERNDPVNRARCIVQDSRKEDKKRNRENDLTLEFVHKSIKNECFYCGETDLLMTLYRIDNSLGHMEINIHPACIRCNIFRGQMPYSIWVEYFAPIMRDLKEKCIIDDWCYPHWKHN